MTCLVILGESSVYWHLLTRECLTHLSRTLSKNDIYLSHKVVDGIYFCASVSIHLRECTCVFVSACITKQVCPYTRRESVEGWSKATLRYTSVAQHIKVMDDCVSEAK